VADGEYAASCDDCGRNDARSELQVVCADLGQGAFLRVLCADCWHRRQYRAKLRDQLLAQRPRL
jgi:hypothetical protein